MTLDQSIPPSGEGSTQTPGEVPQDKPVAYDQKPSTYRGPSGKPSGSTLKPASDSPGHSAAGPVGSTPTKPNPYQSGK